MSALVVAILTTAGTLFKLGMDVYMGTTTETEARGELIELGVEITETDSDAELERYKRLTGDA